MVAGRRGAIVDAFPADPANLRSAASKGLTAASCGDAVDRSADERAVGSSSTIPEHVSVRVESGTPVKVLLAVTGCMLIQPDDRGVEMATRNQDPRDAVRLDTGEMGANPLRGSRAAKDLGQEVQRFLEVTTFVAPRSKHAN